MRKSARSVVMLFTGAGLVSLLLLIVSSQAIAGRSLLSITSTPEPTPTTVPFLQPPFAGTYWLNSYVDHQSPTYRWDDTIVLFDGRRASAIDGIENRLPTFRGGYWLAEAARYVYYDGHNGIDFGTGAGVTVLAAAAGEVVFAGSAPSGCATPLQYVCLKHANGYRTFYLHLEGICVWRGEWVEAGDPLGVSGNSGCSLGPHLHFAVEHEGKITDPYGWQPEDEIDPLVDYSGEQATWLWVPDAPSVPPGRWVSPALKTHTNSTLELLFVPAGEGPAIERVDFLAFYAGAWHHLGSGQKRESGWSLLWDTSLVPEGEVWVHAWSTTVDGRVGKGNPIVKGIVVDRRPPQGYIIDLSPSHMDVPPPTVGEQLWLYAVSYDPGTATRDVTFFVQESGGPDAPAGSWREIGAATWVPFVDWEMEDGPERQEGHWLLQWDVDVADGARIDLVARLSDGAGNISWTEPVQEITVDRSMPGGELAGIEPGSPFTTTMDLVFHPFVSTAAAVSHVAFDVWFDGEWHQVGIDRQGSDGWSVRWDPALVRDQAHIRAQVRAYDVSGRVRTALPQVAGLILDRQPPNAGYVRPASGGVARPDARQQVWASDSGSGVERVEFYVDQGLGWLKIGEDRDPQGGWSLLWPAEGIPDGLVDFSALVFDRAGNAAWTPNVLDVALDRAPPVGRFSSPVTGVSVGGTVTLTLDVTDTVSGLDRAIFYAGYGDRWHHLGIDLDAEDGFSLAWDTDEVVVGGPVTLTAWVYDRAGNYVELPHEEVVVGRVEWSAAVPPSTVLPTMTLTPSPTRRPLATPTLLMSPTLPASPSPTLPPSPTSAPTETAVPQATDTRAPPIRATTVARATSTTVPSPSPIPSATALAAPAASMWPVSRAFWYLVGGGMAVALVLLARSVYALRSTGR